jgi:hypothetical protein
MADLILLTTALPRFGQCGNWEPVTTDDLQPQQFRAVAATSARMRDYFRKLRARMEALRFPVRRSPLQRGLPGGGGGVARHRRRGVDRDAKGGEGSPPGLRFNEVMLERKRAQVFGCQCRSTWAEDVWEGEDRDYAAEAVLCVAGRKDPRVCTRSGPLKRRCACCGAMSRRSTARGTSVPGSSHRMLVGAEC